MTPEEKAFVRGFAAAMAMTVRHITSPEVLLRAIGATEQGLIAAEVDEFDLDTLRPLLRKERQ